MLLLAGLIAALFALRGDIDGVETNSVLLAGILGDIPAGAIPKDGPSAGVTMAMALISLLKETPILSNVAMTGEITLRGRVLPVGGIKEKVLAAKRAGITTVILPKRNEKDLVEVPENAKKEMKFVFVEKVDEMLPIVFGTKEPAVKKKRIFSKA